ncbi:hypothetical protein [Pseudomonas sp.]|uniref:hypothetical protein n=1 Tax=Pseudomonas sp. TaxID=306 RepID=UPI00272AC172|nr:hypothetical protein [Pseudomonas sp.]
MHYIPYLFLALVALLGVVLLTSDPASGYRWLGYTGGGGGVVGGGVVRLLGLGLIVLAVIPLLGKKRKP